MGAPVIILITKVPMQLDFPHSPEQCDAHMRVALHAAREALRFGEVPVGAVVVDSQGIVAVAHNLRETRTDPTAHAEILALKLAAQRKGTWYLTDCTLFVTLEPCPMCAGAAVNARLAGLAYGATDPKAGACGTLYDIPRDERLNHVIPVVSGVLAPECSALVSEFFTKLRRSRQAGEHHQE